MSDFHPEDYLNRRTLVLGEVNAGKTTLAREVLGYFCSLGLGERIAVVDMAPEMPLSLRKGLAGAGGKLEPPEGSGVLYLGGSFEPPRLSSKTEEEARAKAAHNRASIDTLLQALDGQPREILFVNDASMYVQAGGASGLIARMDRCATVVANAYWGESLGGGKLSERERAEMTLLRAYFEYRGKVIFRSRP
jgi:hypothetical protein